MKSKLSVTGEKKKNYLIIKLEFRESDVSPGKTEVKQGKFVEFISLDEGYFLEKCKSQNINPISPNPKFTLGLIQIII